MLPPGHAIISAGIGAAMWGLTRSVSAAVTAVAVGVLMDVDHLLDYYWWLWKEEQGHVWLFLHGYELAIPLFLGAWLWEWHPVVLAAALAHLAHLVTDQFTNHVKPFTYFYAYRGLNRFRREKVTDWSGTFVYQDLIKFPGVALILHWLHPRFRKLEREDPE